MGDMAHPTTEVPQAKDNNTHGIANNNELSKIVPKFPDDLIL